MLFPFIICIIYVIKGIVIVKEEEAVIIEFLGQYSRTLYTGFHFIIPLFEQPRPILTKKVIRTQDGRLYKKTIYSSKVSLR